MRETPHLPLLHLCFLPAAVSSQDKRPSQAPGLPNPALSCLNKWQRSAEWEFLQDFLVCKVKVNFEARLFYFSAVDKNSAEISELNERFLLSAANRKMSDATAPLFPVFLTQIKFKLLYSTPTVCTTHNFLC